jgi:hypothetical protein
MLDAPANGIRAIFAAQSGIDRFAGGGTRKTLDSDTAVSMGRSELMATKALSFDVGD